MDRLAALVLGLFMLLAATVFGLFHYSSRGQTETISVTGAAAQRFESDVVKWSISLSRQVSTEAFGSGYALLRSDLERVRSVLRGAGIPDEAVGVQPVNAMPTWDQYGTRTGFNLEQSVYVIAEGGGQSLEALALDPAPLVETGIVLGSSRLEYFYSGIDELKHELLSAATEDALRRAQEIGGAAGQTVDQIVSARAGVFQITEPFSTEVSDYGIHTTASRTKEITVTVHATFAAE